MRYPVAALWLALRHGSVTITIRVSSLGPPDIELLPSSFPGGSACNHSYQVQLMAGPLLSRYDPARSRKLQTAEV